MEQQYRHSLLVQENHDEKAREAFAMDLAGHLATEIFPGTRTLFDVRIIPSFSRQSERPPDRTEVRHAMLRQPYYQMWSSLKRTNQEMLFDIVGEVVEHQLAGITARSKSPSRTAGGSLRLDSSVKPPRYLTAVDIHCMPGNYTADLGKDDISAGAIFDRGLFLYGGGGLGPQSDDMGASVCAWMEKHYAEFTPGVILDMGCSIGGNTLPFARKFPNATVHAIDVGAGVLRYGHCRAEEFGITIHFSQQNAEHTSLADGSVDLIVSHLLGHETSLHGYRNIIFECHRLLRPGGMMLHTETEWSTETDPFNQSVLDWETHYNGEPFKTTLDKLDSSAVARDAGFLAEKIFAERTPSQRAGTKYQQGQWAIFGAIR
jgi:2-polyprenyl-3-methyl-5-hydroxy-6-metoxy-1,4-benzoquinol methylase